MRSGLHSPEQGGVSSGGRRHGDMPGRRGPRPLRHRRGGPLGRRPAGGLSVGGARGPAGPAQGAPMPPRETPVAARAVHGLHSLQGVYGLQYQLSEQHET